jgi:acetolactate synthase I/II/III large subunit
VRGFSIELGLKDSGDVFMNGAESLVQTLVAGGVEVCFTNPGTSEMHIVAALDQHPELRSVLALFEGVVSGAADGYARMAGKPACSLLHLGPGLANSLANLNIVGEHATFHLPLDTPLSSDTPGIAKPYSSWVRSSRSTPAVGRDAAEGLGFCRTPPGRIATLIVPADLAWSEGGIVSELPAVARPPLPAPETIGALARKLETIQPAALLLAGRTLHGEGLKLAGRIAAATGAKLFAPYPFTRLERGAGTPPVERIPYPPDQAREALKGIRLLVMVGSIPPHAYFASPSGPSACAPSECELQILAKPEEDGVGALENLALALGASTVAPIAEKPQRPAVPAGPLSLNGIATTIAALLPENAIVVDESMTAGRGILAAARGAAPHDLLANTGGSIGIAMPMAVGAAVACPERRVLCLSADGSGMYTLQALWTMAREGLNVTTVIFSNRAYGVLKREFLNLGIGEPGAVASKLFSIGSPDLDWVSLAKGMGVPAGRITSLEQFAAGLKRGFQSSGPGLIELPL